MSLSILPAASVQFSAVSLANSIGTGGRTTSTSNANLCGGHDFYIYAPNVSCSGVDFLWWNNGSTPRTVQARLYDATTSTAATVASGTLAVSADGQYAISWTAVAITPNKLYRMLVGPNDGSAVWSYYTILPTGVIQAVGIQPYVVASMSNYNTAGTGAVSGNIGTNLMFAVQPRLVGI